MFDKIFGLPAHPLLVHAPVVLIPIAVLLAVGYGLVPPLRRRLGWVLVLASLAGAGSAWAAAQAGLKMAATLQASPALTEHAGLGDMLWKYAGLLAVASVVLVGVDVSRHSRADVGARDEAEFGYSHRASKSSGGVMLAVVSLVLTLVMLGAAGVAGYYVVRTGHSGATMVWGNR